MFPVLAGPSTKQLQKTAKGRPRSPAAKALPRRRAWLTLRACRPAATLATTGRGDMQSAVCGGGHEMTAGVHCAHFEIREWVGTPKVGVVGPGVDPAAGDRAPMSAEGWLMATDTGCLRHGGVGWSGDDSKWAGQPGERGGLQAIKEGDVVVRRPPRAALRRGCAEGLACARRAWCSTSTPAGQTHRPEVAS